MPPPDYDPAADPVTPDRLRALGFRQTYLDILFVRLPNGGALEYDTWPSNQADRRWMVRDGLNHERVYLPPISTLADARRLCLALGVTLPPGPTFAPDRVLDGLTDAQLRLVHSAIDARLQQISLGWGVEDVLSVRDDLSEAEAMEVLRRVKNRADASLGVTWDTLAAVAAELFGAGPAAGETEDEKEAARAG